MSVATQHSPFAVGSKRLYESEENEDHLQRLDSSAASSHKRYRHPHQQHLRGSPPGRCGSGGEGGHQHAAYTVGLATVAALRALFPEMSDKVISDVLAEHGDNIDAAIKHLTSLRLSAASTSAATPEQQAAAAEQQQQQQQQQQQGAAAEGPAGPAAAPQKSADEWVDIVVQEMSAAKDMADARARASKVLQAFEQAAVAHSAQAQGAGPDSERLRAQLQDVLRENQLLKRAVAIQNSRMQELGGKEAEAAQLRQMVEGFQQKVHALEMQNYSLALHLKQAADGKDAMQGAGVNRNPDIF